MRLAQQLDIPESNLEAGVIPTEIHKLVKSRQQIKQLMKAPNLSPEQKMDYHIRQMALKLTANSMYGCLGATHCRFYAKGLAALVTGKLWSEYPKYNKDSARIDCCSSAKGREILEDTKHLVEKLQYEVIYGDTDSLMINTNILEYDDVFSIGRKVGKIFDRIFTVSYVDLNYYFIYLFFSDYERS